MSTLDPLPVLGIGIGYRPELQAQQSRYADRIDWFEVIADRYLRSMPESVDQALSLLEHHPLVPHGLEMSVGTDEPLDRAYCEQVAELVTTIRAPFHSDHLCMTRVGGLEIGQLTPLPFTDAAAARCAAKAREAQEILGVPFLLENITYPFAFPGSMSEAEFIGRVVTEADCGLLLDLTNLFINSQNHRYDPHAFLDALPLERVIQVHLAGGERHGDRWIDSHSGSVDAHPEVWSLLEHVVCESSVRAILIERDQKFPDDFAEILDDIDRAREIFDSRRPARPAPRAAVTSATSSSQPLPVDRRIFQLGLARVLVESETRRSFVADPETTAKMLGLDDAQAHALVSAGIASLDAFARDVAGKRLALVSRAVPATHRLLELEGRLADVSRRFIDEHLPRESPEFVNHTVRDGYWLLGLLERMLAEGETCPRLADVIRFERHQLELGTTPTMIESAKDFARAAAAHPRPSHDEIQSTRPCLGAHTRIDAFSCDIAGLVRRLTGGEPASGISMEPTLVLFSKAPGWRNVHHVAINARTRAVLALCDGRHTISEIVAAVWPGLDVDESMRRCEQTTALIRKLHELNAIALESTNAAAN